MRALVGWGTALFALVTLAGCAHEPTFQLPMTAADAASHDSAPALVAYLSQPDASAAVCDRRARGPHVAALDEPMREGFVHGLVSGRVEPALWEQCADALLEGAAPKDAASLMDEIGRAYRALVKDSSFETRPDMQDRVAAMQKLYLERANRIRDPHEALKDLLFDLRRALAGDRLGPVAARFGRELIAAVDAEAGVWKGRAVDAPLLDSLYVERDETTLGLFVERLPDVELREEARRRIVRLHIAVSPFPEVRARAEDVERRVLARGNNAIATDREPPLRGWLDLAKVPMRGVLVRQDVVKQTATLIGVRNVARPLSVLPDVQLRGALVVEVQGVSRPVTLCAPRRDLDPTPCIAAADVELENPVAYLDEGGSFRFVDRLSMREAVSLTSMHERFELPVSIGGKRLLSFEWPFHYERPEDVYFDGTVPAATGPHLFVKVDHRDPNRYVFEIANQATSYFAVVEAADLGAFHVVSRGARGESGSIGSSGSDGASGGECSSGGSGGPGGPGGDGGPGGTGGDVDVELDCGDASCADALSQLRATVLSLGGPGGFGGSGGSGGAGGAGGSGRSATTHTDADGNTVVDDPGCSGGSSGSSGSSGPSGSDGPRGAPGTVTFSARARARSR